MSKKQIFTIIVVAAILVVLFYFQFRQYKHFPWDEFNKTTKQLFTDPHRLWRLILAVALIYVVYVLRALRWAIFLRPIKKVSTASLTPSQFIGFTGLALLGRPGELIRPYIISKKHELSFASQLAVWSVERLFDMGAFAFLFAVSLFKLPPELYSMAPKQVSKLQEGSYILILVIVCLAFGAFLLRVFRSRVSTFVETKLTHGKAGHSFGRKMVAFADGLNTIHDFGSFVQLAAISLLIWFLIAVSYVEIIHAYPDPVLGNLSFRAVFFVMAGSMVGSMLQLPAVGGGAQLATITVMNRLLGVSQAYATSCGLVLWLITFASVIPMGLLLAHREHLSIRKLTEESETEVEA